MIEAKFTTTAQKRRTTLQKLKNLFIAFAGMTVLIVLISLAVPSGTKGQSGRDAKSPADVNIVNTPMVNARQDGPWSVGVEGTPTVALTADASVHLSNGADNPVPVRDIDNLQQPFQKSIIAPSMPSGSAITDVTFTVPDGKRLVLEFASINGGVPSGQTLTAYLQTHVGDEFNAIFPIVMTQVGSFGNLNVFHASQPIKLYADRGTTVRCAAIRTGTADNASAVGFTLAGYLVDVPPSAPQ